MKKEQTMRYTDDELALIKSTFAENTELLKAVRKVFLQLPLTELEERLIKNTFSNKSLMSVMHKAFLPVIDGDAPMNQVIDLWMTVKIDDKTVGEAYPFIMARELVINYVAQQLNELETGEKGNIKLENLIGGDNEFEVYKNLVARNTIITHVEGQLARELKTLAGLKSETTEETVKRLSQNSNK